MSRAPCRPARASLLTPLPRSLAAKFGRFLPRGVYAPINTFFHEDESLDLDTFKKHAQYVASAGGELLSSLAPPTLSPLASSPQAPQADPCSSALAVGLVALGSMGEGASLGPPAAARAS